MAVKQKIAPSPAMFGALVLFLVERAPDATGEASPTPEEVDSFIATVADEYRQEDYAHRREMAEPAFKMRDALFPPPKALPYSRMRRLFVNAAIPGFHLAGTPFTA